MMDYKEDLKDKVNFPQQQRHLAPKWKTTNSDFPPKLKSQLLTPSCHLYLIYSLTVLCILLSTYTFSNMFKLQNEVGKCIELISSQPVSKHFLEEIYIPFKVKKQL